VYLRKVDISAGIIPGLIQEGSVKWSRRGYAKSHGLAEKRGEISRIKTYCEFSNANRLKCVKMWINGLLGFNTDFVKDI
jgi:hypothetical protein